MSTDELRALCDRVWLGRAFTLEVADGETVNVIFDARELWDGAPSRLLSKADLTGLEPNQVVPAILRAASNALIHELLEAATLDGMRFAQPHPYPMISANYYRRGGRGDRVKGEPMTNITALTDDQLIALVERSEQSVRDGEPTAWRSEALAANHAEAVKLATDLARELARRLHDEAQAFADAVADE